MNEQFILEEINLMCIFDTSSRDALITELTAAVRVEEPELLEIAENVLGKLSVMSGEDFAALELYPEYGDCDEQEE